MAEQTRARLVDVAQRAGVSPRTVSNVLHNHPHVRSSTRKRVEDALAELNYKANLSARALASGSTGFITLAIPGLDNPYYSTLAGHIIDACAALDWTVLIEQTASQAAREREAILGPSSRLVDGVILQPDALDQHELKNRFAHHNLVLIGEAAATASADHVTADNVQAAKELAQHLIAQGRTRIATLGIRPQETVNASELRYRGISHAMEEAGLRWRSEYLVEVQPFRRPEGAAAVDDLLAMEHPPEAIICFNDLLAAGALAQLHKRGVDVPSDIAVAGFDDNEESRFTIPPLTSISWNTAEVAKQCVQQLYERSRGNRHQSPPSRTLVDHQLVIRESTEAPAPGR